jgi:hypothetical protein
MHEVTAMTNHTDEIDEALLSFLIRSETSLPWTDSAFPEGLDLSHPGDFDWVCREVALRCDAQM